MNDCNSSPRYLVLIARTVLFGLFACSCMLCSADSITAVVVKIGANWVVVVPKIDELSDLVPIARASKSGVVVPVCLTTGKWLAGQMGADGKVKIVLSDGDLTSIVPGYNNLDLQGPASTLVHVRFDSSSMLKSDSDLRSVANARMYPLTMTSSGNTVTVAIGVVAKRLTFSFDKVPTSPVSGLVRMAIGLPSRFKLLPSDFVNDIENGKVVTASIEIREEGAVDAVSFQNSELHSASLMAAQRVGPIRTVAFKSFSPRALTLAAREAIPLFRFDEPGLAGWEIRGHGWGTTDTVGEFFSRKGDSRYFADSKVDGGEPATGTILSQPFIMSGSKLRFLANGHSKRNYYALVDAKTEEELIRSPVPEKTGPFEAISWDVSKFKGRKVRFMAVDNDTATAYAWLAFDNVELIP